MASDLDFVLFIKCPKPITITVSFQRIKKDFSYMVNEHITRTYRGLIGPNEFHGICDLGIKPSTGSFIDKIWFFLEQWYSIVL